MTRIGNRKKRVISAVCAVMILAAVCGCLALPAAAERTPAPESAQVGTALLSCLDTGGVLYEKDADRVIYPASSVKIMTGLLLCRSLGARLDEAVTLTDAMLSGVSGRSLHLAAGETLTVRDLLYAALCGSYNDALNALAVYAAGSAAACVSVMNREAERLGAAHTHYTNPTGLHDEGMYTTARDVAIVAREAYGNELYMEITSAPSYLIPATSASPERAVGNRNLLLSDSSLNYRNGWCRGMSAGMTDEGGWCVVTVCERDGVSLLCVVMQGADVPNGEIIPAYSYANALLSWARGTFGVRELVAPGEKYIEERVLMTGLSSSRTWLTVPDGLYAYLPLDADPDTDLSISCVLTDGALTAPLTAGDVVGMITVMYDGEVVGTAHLTVTKDFKRNAFVNGLAAFRRYLTSRAFLAAVVIFVVLLVVYLRSTFGPGARSGFGHRPKRTKRYFKR